MKFSSIPLSFALVSIAAIPSACSAQAAQTQTPAQATPTRIVGSVTAINGPSITVKPDSGAPVTITVSDAARILETQPGAKTLAGATPIPLSSIAVGDRVLAAVKPASDGTTVAATTLIAMKQADVAQHQQEEEADWQRRGAGGLVKTVDATTETVTITSGTHTITVHVTPTTIIRRYSPDSIKFSDSHPSSLAQIQPGDQLRVRGDRSADGTEITADGIIAGTFRNIAGTVVSTEPTANTITVRDLVTKKLIDIQVNAESQMHKLPDQMAQFLAMRLKHSDEGQPQQHPASETSAASSDHSTLRASGGGQRSGDLSQMLQRTPPVQLSALHKGDAVMIVATQGTPASATAVTLLAGVEPILTASPSASQSMFSASWDVGGGGSAAGTQGTP